jgi:hypothetical protein
MHNNKKVENILQDYKKANIRQTKKDKQKKKKNSSMIDGVYEKVSKIIVLLYGWFFMAFIVLFFLYGLYRINNIYIYIYIYLTLFIGLERNIAFKQGPDKKREGKSRIVVCP